MQDLQATVGPTVNPRRAAYQRELLAEAEALRRLVELAKQVQGKAVAPAQPSLPQPPSPQQ